MSLPPDVLVFMSAEGPLAPFDSQPMATFNEFRNIMQNLIASAASTLRVNLAEEPRVLSADLSSEGPPLMAETYLPKKALVPLLLLLLLNGPCRVSGFSPKRRCSSSLLPSPQLTAAEHRSPTLSPTGNLSCKWKATRHFKHLADTQLSLTNNSSVSLSSNNISRSPTKAAFKTCCDLNLSSSLADDTQHHAHHKQRMQPTLSALTMVSVRRYRGEFPS